MKSLIVAGALALLPSFASAQSMTCADYLKAEKEMAASMGANAPKLDAESAALDKKLKDYCTKNPTAAVEKAMEAAVK